MHKGADHYPDTSQNGFVGDKETNGDCPHVLLGTVLVKKICNEHGTVPKLKGPKPCGHCETLHTFPPEPMHAPYCPVHGILTGSTVAFI